MTALQTAGFLVSLHIYNLGQNELVSKSACFIWTTTSLIDGRAGGQMRFLFDKKIVTITIGYLRNVVSPAIVRNC